MQLPIDLEKLKHLLALCSLLEYPCMSKNSRWPWLPRCATMAHYWQYTSPKAPWFPSMIHQLKSQGVIRKSHKIFFQICFCPPVLLRRENEKASGWASGSQQRLTHHTPVNKQTHKLVLMLRYLNIHMFPSELICLVTAGRGD